MKKRKLREQLQGRPFEWPKSMSTTLIQELERLPNDAEIILVCEQPSSMQALHQSLGAARRQAQEREKQWQPMHGSKMFIRATLRFLRYWLWESGVRPLNANVPRIPSFMLG